MTVTNDGTAGLVRMGRGRCVDRHEWFLEWLRSELASGKWRCLVHAALQDRDWAGAALRNDRDGALRCVQNGPCDDKEKGQGALPVFMVMVRRMTDILDSSAPLRCAQNGDGALRCVQNDRDGGAALRSE